MTLRGPRAMFRVLACLVAVSAGAADHDSNPTVALGTGVLDAYVVSDYPWTLPRWMPKPLEPRENRTTPAKVELGRRLFYDTRLSVNQVKSCASCHVQALAFTDGLKVSPGALGHSTLRNSMSLANVAYSPVLTWSNPLLHTLEQQVLVPLMGQHPVEMGMAGRDEELIARLREEPIYPPLFAKAFREAREAITVSNVVRALAAFERTLISAHSRGCNPSLRDQR
jgi:cytochrome c peroxidase